MKIAIECTLVYQMEIYTVSSALIISGIPFEFIKGYISNDTIDYLLCNKCEVHLIYEDTDKANDPQFIWTDFYWNILRCKYIRNHYSSDFIWKIVPFEWCEWWFDEIVLQFTAYYNSIYITYTQSIFMDRIKDLETWNEEIKYQKLSSIPDVCNQFLLTNVLCLWGCLEFIHKIGYVDLDTVIKQFIQKCNLYTIDV